MSDKVGLYELFNGMWQKTSDTIEQARVTAESTTTDISTQLQQRMGQEITDVDATFKKILDILGWEDIKSQIIQSSEQTLYNWVNERLNILSNSFTNEITSTSPGNGDKGVQSKAIAKELNNLLNIYTKKSITVKFTGGTVPADNTGITNIVTIGNLKMIFADFSVSIPKAKYGTIKFHLEDCFKKSESTTNVNGILFCSKDSSSKNSTWSGDRANKLYTFTKPKGDKDLNVTGRYRCILFYQLNIENR